MVHFADLWFSKGVMGWRCGIPNVSPGTFGRFFVARMSLFCGSLVGQSMEKLVSGWCGESGMFLLR